MGLWLDVIPFVGPCVRARESDPKFDCDPEGFFQPIQCQVLEDRTTACRCVNPLTGIAIFGSEKRITYHSDKPVCSNTQNGKQLNIFQHSQFNRKVIFLQQSF